MLCNLRGIRLRQRASEEATCRASLPTGRVSTQQMSSLSSSSSSWPFPMPCRSVFPGWRCCSSALMAASCWRKKSAFCCLERDLSTAVAILELTSTMESCFARTLVMVEDAMKANRWIGVLWMMSALFHGVGSKQWRLVSWVVLLLVKISNHGEKFHTSMHTKVN